MIIQQTKVFARQKKRLHCNQIKALDEAVHAISKKPLIGIKKKGDLSFMRVYKFKIILQEWLLAYQIINANTIILLALASHENFYRDLKRSLQREA